MSKVLLIFLFTTNLFSAQSYYENGQKIELTPYILKKSASFGQNTNDKNSSIRYYKKSNSQIVGVSNSIIAKCLNTSECERVIKKYTTLKFTLISKNIYLIYLQNQDEIFDISVKLYEEGCFLYVQPNFYKEKKLR